MGITRTTLISLALSMASLACSSDPDSDTSDTEEAPFGPNDPYDPMVEPSDLTSNVTNPFLPMPVGASWTILAETEDGLERIEVSVTADTRTVWGVEALVVQDTAYLDDVIIEDTWDWFAQDGEGNVWYLGEETQEYVDGMPGTTAGSWEAGVEGALPGIVMLAEPTVGTSYRQEYYKGEAEDYGTVVSLDETVSVPGGDFENCIKIRERSVIDPELDEMKYYCEGVGNVLIEEEDVREELVDSSLL
jgi:hypothetical protein